MKLSLITVTFNSAKTINDTIGSVRSQANPNIEYIIIDGGSNDGTLDIIKTNSDLITTWISEPDNGIYEALNKGLDIATGEIVGFLHADDIFANTNILNEIISAFENSDADFLYGDLVYITSRHPFNVIRYWQSGPFLKSSLYRGWMPPHPTVYFKRNLLHRTGLFNTQFKIAADYDWLLRCLTIPELKVYYLPKVMVKMRVGGASNKNIYRIIKKTKEDYRAIKSNKVGGIYTLFYKNFGKLNQFFYQAKEE